MVTIDYRKKVLEFIATDLASEDIGLYPKTVNGVPRTDWQEGWNECAMANSRKAVAIQKFISECNETIQDYIIAEVIRLTVDKEKNVSMYILCNDLFFWACADSEEFELSDLDDLNQAYKDSPEDGDLLWCCRKRGMRPQKPYYKYFKEPEHKLFDACGPEEE